MKSEMKGHSSKLSFNTFSTELSVLQPRARVGRRLKRVKKSVTHRNRVLYYHYNVLIFVSIVEITENEPTCKAFVYG